MTVTKSQAAVLFRRHRLEGLPTIALPTGAANPDRLIADAFPRETTFTLRACGNGEEKNLPRLIGCTPDRARDWMSRLGGASSVLVQPYDDLLFSVELLVTDTVFHAEIIAGIWELDNQAEPLTLTVTPEHQVTARLRGPVAVQPARFWLAGEERAVTCYCSVQDWMVTEVMLWIHDRTEALRALRDEIGCDIGIKVHYARRFGLSPQNIHTDGLGRPVDECRPVPPPTVPLISSTRQELAPCTAVKIAVGIAREEHAALVAFAERLSLAGIDTVYVRSGLLSHMAITLRQQGFTVRRW